MSAADDTDDFDLPAVERDDIATGAAAEEGTLCELPATTILSRFGKQLSS
jgi:hypothetical protein